jgi:cysteine desulfurase
MTATLRLPIYLDHHATTSVDPRVLEAMLPWFTEKFGNAASVNHPFGWEAAEGVETGREQVARLLNVSPKSIVFTSGATEANNLALKGVMRAVPPESHLIVSAAEHRSVLDPAKKLRRAGYAVTVLPVAEAGEMKLGAPGPPSAHVSGTSAGSFQYRSQSGKGTADPMQISVNSAFGSPV